MESSLQEITYSGESGNARIRTFTQGDILYISLKDVLVTLNRENDLLDDNFVPKNMPGLIKRQLEVLEKDEYLNLRPNQNNETFITQPGLYRVLAGDNSKAGRKFQKWLFHEVVPSITKYGVYPPPAYAKGSALSQMAEMLAQNSRALADTILKQELLEQKVSDVIVEIDDVKNRVDVLEGANGALAYLSSVPERLESLGMTLNEEQLGIVLAWCENISLSKSRVIGRCGSGSRQNTKFSFETIDEAIVMFEESQRLR